MTNWRCVYILVSLEAIEGLLQFSVALYRAATPWRWTKTGQRHFGYPEELLYRLALETVRRTLDLSRGT